MKHHIEDHALDRETEKHVTNRDRDRDLDEGFTIAAYSTRSVDNEQESVFN